MLKKSYNRGIIGLNYLSLITGMISLKNKKSVLVIDEKNLLFANKWHLNIGYMERKILIFIGRKYAISPLVELDRYLAPEVTLLSLNETLLELSDSPFINIKEIARKIPQCFSTLFPGQLEDCDSKKFDEDFFHFLDNLVDDSFDLFINSKLSTLFDKNENLDLGEVFSGFLDFLNKDELITKQLHYVLQMMFQTVVSSGKDDLESKYLLISLISPRYKVNSQILQDELMYEYKKLGGDIRVSSIKDWGISNHRLNYILLETIDGAIELNETFYFGQISEQQPFKAAEVGTQFLSISLKCQLKHEFIDLFRNKRVVFSAGKRMGSDFPYWEVTIDNNGLLVGVYSYADYLGTKASLYYQYALNDLYESIENILPGLVRNDWKAQTVLSQGSDIWFEYPSSFKKDLCPQKKSNSSSMYAQEDSELLSHFHLAGPGRAKSLGLSSYLLDIFSQ